MMTCKSQKALQLEHWHHCLMAPMFQLTCSYDLHEEAREAQRVGQMKCRLCGKVFRTGKFLDQHLDIRHANHTHQVSCSWQCHQLTSSLIWPTGALWALQACPCKQVSMAVHI